MVVLGRILLVDDEPDVLEYLAQQLQKGGYEVYPALSGEAAIHLCETEKLRFDILVADLVLPGISGFTLSDMLKPLYPRMKRIFISGHTGAEYFRQLGVSPADIPFLQKPFAPDELLQKVGELMATISRRSPK